MRYPGSKKRFGRQLKSVIESVRTHQTAYLEPFLGGGESFEAIAPLFDRAYGGDIHEDIALMWQAVAQGWEPPIDVSEELYHSLRHQKPSALRGFVGAGCSFGGKWFGGFARGGFNGTNPRNHQNESQRAVVRAAPAFNGAEVRHCSYEDWNPQQDTLVYCDPPYIGTLKYAYHFDHSIFWDVMGEWSANGVTVLVSEGTAPPHWKPIATMSRLNSTALASDRSHCLEHIWVME